MGDRQSDSKTTGLGWAMENALSEIDGCGVHHDGKSARRLCGHDRPSVSPDKDTPTVNGCAVGALFLNLSVVVENELPLCSLAAIEAGKLDRHEGANMSDQAPEKDQKEARKTGGWYAHYVLFVLVIVYVFNFIDRNILSILSQEIQKDLGVSDAEMGFLYGTVFAVFYAVFGIPLARFADVYVRKNLISVGLMFWSAMTALSGFAKSFPQLALFRIGVGVGEASASPAAFSMLSDYYAPKVRATVLAIYSSGVYIGGGIGLFLGGFVMETWDATYVVQSEAPMGIRGWQAAFLAVGIPGILMAFWVWTLKEPQRGQSEGLITEVHPTPFKVLGTELAAMLPIVNLIGLRRLGVSLPLNLAMGGAIAAAAYVLILITDNIPQWVALGLGVYVTVSWVQALKARDPATHAMMFKAKGLIYTLLAFPSIAFVTYGIGYWTAPLLLRLHDTSPAEVGMYIGLGSAAGGLIGVTLGGIIGDWAKSNIQPVD